MLLLGSKHKNFLTFQNLIKLLSLWLIKIWQKFDKNAELTPCDFSNFDPNLIKLLSLPLVIFSVFDPKFDKIAEQQKFVTDKVIIQQKFTSKGQQIKEWRINTNQWLKPLGLDDQHFLTTPLNSNQTEQLHNN